MKRLVLAVVLLVGCIGGKPPVTPDPGTPDDIAETLAKVAPMVQLASRIVDAICDQQGPSTQVCRTLSHSMDMVAFAANDAQKLYDTYRRTGVGLELVQQAVNAVFTAIDSLNGHAALAKMVIDGSSHPMATASCGDCCRSVVQPPKSPTPEAHPGGKPLPAKKAP
jgi:hypothetical protein